MAVEYLERDHPVFGGRPDLWETAARAVLRLGLDLARRYRLEFDEHHLRATLKDEDFAVVVPDPAERPVPPWHYRVIEAGLDPIRRARLLDALVPEGPAGPAAGTVSIRSLRLLDNAGRTLLRVGDHGTFILFELPSGDRDKLARALQSLGLPPEVAIPVDLDWGGLHP